jgi:hypothetical protein
MRFSTRVVGVALGARSRSQASLAAPAFASRAATPPLHYPKSRLSRAVSCFPAERAGCFENGLIMTRSLGNLNVVRAKIGPFSSRAAVPVSTSTRAKEARYHPATTSCAWRSRFLPLAVAARSQNDSRSSNPRSEAQICFGGAETMRVAAEGPAAFTRLS